MMTVKEFYDLNPFPGPYTQQGLMRYTKGITNPYIKFIDNYLGDNQQILDVGCGTGLVCNYLAQKHNKSQFTAIDFSTNGINYARQFAQEQKISNIKFYEKDILDFESYVRYDVVYCHGVLHHIPQYHTALQKLHDLLNPNGILILGLYHPVGKILKKFIQIDYGSDILAKDQEQHVYETSYTKSQVLLDNNEFRLMEMWPRQPWLHFMLNPIQYSKSGGLTVYAFKNNNLN